MDNDAKNKPESQDDHDGLLQRLEAVEREKNRLARELRTITKRYEIDRLNNATQIGLNRIITDEKQKQELYVRLLLEAHPDPIALFDENLKFLIGTKAAGDIIGTDDISLLQGRTIDNIHERFNPPAFTEKIPALMKTLVASRGNGAVETNLELATDDNNYDLTMLPFHKDNGEFAGVLVILHDITEIIRSKKIAEQASYAKGEFLSRMSHEIRTKKIAEQASYAKGEFLSRMSHEIRTPLNAIIGMIHIGMGTEDIEKKNYCLNRADSASKHLLGIINDILDMSKIEADKFELSYSEFDFEKTLKTITNMANVRAEEKWQNFIVEISEDVPAFILSDELRLSQVITNLLTNAIKFTPEHGTVALRVAKLEEINNDVVLKIEVADTGIGIAEEQQRRLFTSFNQADASISQKFGGTGLGLAISKRIVELMRGKIWIESELGKGANFIFTIRAKKAEEKNRTQLSEKIDRNKIHILAVDDSEETRNYFIHAMKALKLSCDVASGGPQAVHMVKNATDKPYNVFFVDQHMPDMNGIELAQHITAINGDSSIVLILPAKDWNAVEKEAMAAGVKHFISKPLFPSTLINAVNMCRGAELDGPAEGTRQEAPKGHFNFRDHTLLVAEDIEINREIISAVLEETGVSIDYAENGKIAVAMFNGNPGKYSLILMDINMPEMDGFEATRHIRSLDAAGARDVPIIAMTANVFKEDIEKCMASGMNGHTGKPVDADALFGILSTYLSRPGKNAAMEKAHAMEYGITWNDSLLTGNAMVDMQHKTIFARLRDLVQACEDGNDLEHLQDTIDFLLQYTIRHFADEEALQREYGCPDHMHHKNEHKAFTAIVNALARRFSESGSSAQLSADVNKIVVKWLVHHIQITDKKMSDHIRRLSTASLLRQP